MKLRMALFAVILLAGAPASAQVDFSGEWAPRFWEDQPERVPGPELGDYLGIPISDAARLRAETWDASIQTLPEWQCRPHSADYIWRGPSNLRISKEVDPVSREVTAFHAEWLRSVDRTVYLDGRPHPPADALHTWAGFSTARWVGDILEVTVTHLKEGYLRRNGLPRSDKATVKEYWMRNGDYLTVAAIVHDPVYLTEPFIRTTDYELNVHQQVAPYPCNVVQEVDREKGAVPHLLPGTNPFTTEFATRYGIPLEATRGGAATMYPDYRLKMKNMPRRRRRSSSARRGDDSAHHDSRDARPSRWPCVTATGVVAQQNPARVQVLPVRGNIYLLQGAGANIVVSVGRDGVLMVDTGLPQMSDAVLAAISALQSQLDLRERPPGFRRGNTLKRRRPPGRGAGQADSLHHQHARPSRSRWRQREASTRGANVRRWKCRAGRERRRARCRHPGAREGAAADVAARSWRAGGAVRCAADGHLFQRRHETESFLQRRGDSAAARACRPTPTATRSCTSAGPM